MNQVMFVGRIVRPIELKNLSDNSRVCNNVLAVRRRNKSKSGDADFIPFVAWNQTADLLKRYCQKGQQVALSGKMRSRSYDDKDGKTRYTIECIVDEVTLVSTRSKADQDQEILEEILETIQ